MSAHATSPALTPATTFPSTSGTIVGRKLAPKASRTRFKPQLSCMLCRTRKLKCDRNLPCDNCQKRGLSSSCSYVNSVIRDKNSQVRRTGNGNIDVQARIQHLEAMVTTLANRQQASRQVPSNSTNSTENGLHDPNGPCDDLNGSEDSFGRISIEENQVFVGSAHWAAVLENIAELKDCLEEAEKQREGVPEKAPQGPDLLVGANNHATRDEILAGLPSRPVVDELMRQYFRSMDLASALIHIPTFKKEYENFWRDPSATSIMWIGLLFGFLTLASHFQYLSQAPLAALSASAIRSPKDLANMFRLKTVQCLILGNYLDPGPYTVQTLLVYMISEYLGTSDAHFPIWIVWGIVVRTAMRMGYHRDASHYPNISVFQGEMQRRHWHIIQNLDLLASCQVGLPRMMKKGISDTALPHHLLDEDFSPETTVLPPERPKEEPTSMGYSIVKFRITSVLGEIVDLANSTQPSPYAEVMRLDAALNDVRSNIPNYLQFSHISDIKPSATVSTTVIAQKLALELNFQKARCVLHKKFVVSQSSTSESDMKTEYPYSVKSCVDASMKILQYHMRIHQEAKPRGSLYLDRWKVIVLMAHDYLLAGMLVCLYLGQNLTEGNATSVSGGIPWTGEEMLFVLDESYRVWLEISSSSKEAMKAAKALKTMIAKIRNARSQNKVNMVPADLDVGLYSGTGSESEQAAAENSDTEGINHLASWYQIPDAITDPLSAPPDDLMMENVMNGPSSNLNLGWELWDSQFQGTAMCDTTPELWNFDTSSTSLPFQGSIAGDMLMDWGQGIS